MATGLLWAAVARISSPQMGGGTETAQQAPAAKPVAQSDAATVGTYVTQSSQGTWLFPPNPNGGGANG